MNAIDIENLYKSYLLIDHHIVGVKLYNHVEEFNISHAKQRKNKTFYCQLVKKAVHGKHRKADLSNFSCETAGKLLGLDEFYETEEGIDGWFDSGLYANRSLAEIEHMSVFPVRGKTHGIEVGPISKMQVEADVVIIVCKPYQAMRLVQGYTYHYGFKKDFQLSGMCGVCFESTALPLTNHEFSVSLLCSGTRFMCKWPDDMMMVSFPYDMAEKILEGIIETAQPTEPNNYKVSIHNKLHHYKLSKGKKLKANQAYFYSNKNKQ